LFYISLIVTVTVMSGEEKTAAAWELTQLRCRLQLLESSATRLADVLSRIDECDESLRSTMDNVRTLSARVSEHVEICELLREHLAVLAVNERVIRDSLAGDNAVHRRQHMLRLATLGAEKAEVESELKNYESERSRLAGELADLQSRRERLERELETLSSERDATLKTMTHT